MERPLVILVGFFSLFVVLAMVAILISQNAQTSKVIQAITTGGANLITSAVSPVTGKAGVTS